MFDMFRGHDCADGEPAKGGTDFVEHGAVFARPHDKFFNLGDGLRTRTVFDRIGLDGRVGDPGEQVFVASLDGR